jgi:hypothetical protein
MVTTIMHDHECKGSRLQRVHRSHLYYTKRDTLDPKATFPGFVGDAAACRARVWLHRVEGGVVTYLFALEVVDSVGRQLV